MKKAVLAVTLAAAVAAGSGNMPVWNGKAQEITSKTYMPVSASKDKKKTEEKKTKNSEQSVLEQAKIMYAQYNYDEAIKLLKSQKDFEKNKDYMDIAAKCQVAKASLVEYPIEKITHVFFHTLVKDTSKAFDGDSDSGGYNQVMTTIDEFNKIIQTMYDKGYVLVSPHDMATVNKDGSMSRGKIMLPKGKIPFVLSQDDVSYYHYMDGDGYASRLVLDKNGEVKCEYIEDDGTVSVGNYDMVPLLDEFVKQHPDFSYHGRKGILAMTGYNGVLGYRTDIAYKTKENLQDNQREFLEKHPDFDYEADVAAAKKVADAMKSLEKQIPLSLLLGQISAAGRDIPPIIRNFSIIRAEDIIITVMWIPASILYSFQTSICAREEEIWTDTECIIIRKCSVTCLTCRRSGILQDPLRYLKCDRINERKASERSYL